MHTHTHAHAHAHTHTHTHTAMHAYFFASCTLLHTYTKMTNFSVNASDFVFLGVH